MVHCKYNQNKGIIMKRLIAIAALSLVSVFATAKMLSDESLRECRTAINVNKCNKKICN